MSKLLPLNIADHFRGSKETPYVDVSSYKYLKTTVFCDKAAKLIACFSIDGKKDCTYNTHQINASEWCSYKIDISARFLKFTVVLEESGPCGECIVNSLGRRSIPSDIMAKFLPSVEQIELPPPLTLEQQAPSKPLEKFTRNFKINKKPVVEQQKVEDWRIPKLLLAGNLLYCKNNVIDVIPPAPNDGRIYMLTMRDKQIRWIAVGDEWHM